MSMFEPISTAKSPVALAQGDPAVDPLIALRSD